MDTPLRQSTHAVDYRAAAPWMGLLFAVAVLAFWPSYLSLPFGKYTGYTHVHAAGAAVWMLLLIVQPALVKSRRLAWHRGVGRASYFIAPFIVLSIALLAHERLRLAPAQMYPLQTYILYLQLSLAVLFGGLYALAVHWRRNTAVHSRLMVCTALALVDPIAIRVLFWLDPQPTWNYQWATFGLTDAILLAMIYLDRRNPAGRRVLLWVLAACVALQLPALLGFTDGAAWQAFAAWYGALPLT
jgi:hypothetical protein